VFDDVRFLLTRQPGQRLMADNGQAKEGLLISMFGLCLFTHWYNGRESTSESNV
jgi:hypothetical protein